MRKPALLRRRRRPIGQRIWRPASRHGVLGAVFRRHFWKRAGLVLAGTKTIVVNVGTILAIALVVFTAVKELRQDTIQLASIDVPQSLADAGFTSKVLANRIIDHIRAI